MDSRQELEKHTKVSIMWSKSLDVLVTSLKWRVPADNSIWSLNQITFFLSHSHAFPIATQEQLSRASATDNHCKVVADHMDKTDRASDELASLWEKAQGLATYSHPSASTTSSALSNVLKAATITALASFQTQDISDFPSWGGNNGDGNEEKFLLTGMSSDESDEGSPFSSRRSSWDTTSGSPVLGTKRRRSSSCCGADKNEERQSQAKRVRLDGRFVKQWEM